MNDLTWACGNYFSDIKMFLNNCGWLTSYNRCSAPIICWQTHCCIAISRFRAVIFTGPKLLHPVRSERKEADSNIGLCVSLFLVEQTGMSLAYHHLPQFHMNIMNSNLFAFGQAVIPKQFPFYFLSILFMKPISQNPALQFVLCIRLITTVDIAWNICRINLHANDHLLMSTDCSYIHCCRFRFFFLTFSLKFAVVGFQCPDWYI